MMKKHTLALCMAACLMMTGSADYAQAAPPTQARLDASDPTSLFEVSVGRLEYVREGDDAFYRWHIPAGQTSSLTLRKDIPLAYHLPQYERFELQFRVASGAINELRAQAASHISGPRAYKMHQWDIAIFTTPRQQWHRKSIDLSRPSWFPWDDKDGIGREPLFSLFAMALENNTVVELRDMTFRKEMIRLKPDFEIPVTWPVLTRHDDGSATYVITHHLQNTAGRPADITLKRTSQNKAFTIGLYEGEKPPALPAEQYPEQITLSTTANQRVAFHVVAHLPASEAAKMQELEHELLEISFSSPDLENVTWRQHLTRPLSPSLQRQVLMNDSDIAAVRKAIADNNDAVLKALGIPRIFKSADEFLTKELLALPRGNDHVRNNWVGDWRPAERMPEIINTKTKEKEFGTHLAGRTWKEYLGHVGNACENLGLAYLYSGDEKYAEKAIELFNLYARQYQELSWNNNNDSPWAQGPAVLSASRTAAGSSYGSNWYFKGHSRLLSAISGSKAWTPEVKQRVYEGFIMPYVTELMKFDAPISNMSDVTNHNLLLLGIVFDDANLVRHALRNDAGLLSRLTDINMEGFSSEGRSMNYHLAGLNEAVPSLGYAVRSGLKLDLPVDRLTQAIAMPYQRAALTGIIPNSGDMGRGGRVSPVPVADQLYELVPSESWLADVGRGMTIRQIVAGQKPEPDAWKQRLETTPRLFKESGLAILRTGDTPLDQIMVTLDFGRSVFHAHKDRQQFTLQARGKIYSHGPGSLYNVGGGLIRSQDAKLNSFVSQGSLSQNVILVDMQDQLPAIGTLKAWSDKPDFQVAASEVTGIAPGVTHLRAVVLTQGIVFVLDRIGGQQQHTFDFVYHNLGVLSSVGGQGWNTSTPEQPLATISNYQNLIDLKHHQGPGPIHLTWDLTDNLPPARPNTRQTQPAEKPVAKLDLWQLPVAGGAFYTATTGLNNLDTSKMPDTAPSLIQRAQGQQVFFATVLEPNDGQSRIRSIAPAGKDGVTVELTNGSKITVHLDELIQKHGVK